MPTQTVTLHVRMDAETKRKAMEALSDMGLTASQAVRVLFHRIAIDQAFPLELKVPNTQTRSAMAEIDEMVNRRNPRFASADEMFAEIHEPAGPRLGAVDDRHLSRGLPWNREADREEQGQER